MNALRKGDTPLRQCPPFDSSIDRSVVEVWEEQWVIGCDQMLKGQVYRKWSRAQGLFHEYNPVTKEDKQYTGELWAVATIAIFLEFILGL